MSLLMGLPFKCTRLISFYRLCLFGLIEDAKLATLAPDFCRKVPSAVTFGSNKPIYTVFMNCHY